MILVVTKNSDTFSNPTLFGLFKFLEERKIKSILICTENFFNYKFNYNKIIIWQKQPNYRAKNIFKTSCALFIYIKQKFFIQFVSKKVTTIIGVDPEGIIWADEIRHHYIPNATLDYLSFEIFWKHAYKNKKKEIEACKRLRNLIVQDALREKLLRSESQINNNIKTFYIPVAIPDFKEKFNNDKVVDIRRKYNISSDKKLIVFFGTFAKWSGGELIYELINNKKLPDNYVLIIHSRYPFNSKDDLQNRMIQLANERENFFISTDYISSFNQTIDYLTQFDLGFVFYVPDFNNMYVGENIYNIGLASGKFSQYMKAGLPAITVNLPTYVELNNEYNFGYTINTVDEIPVILNNNINYKLLSQNTLRLFKEKLNPTIRLNQYIDQL
ncbi:MAG: hypothetical protein JSR09_06170 [Bacteroidetes bacterium]|nr:hypothetical protein [Bacteroidota bacterium]MBS1649275.1 hypothetical protein [Bacteroidota bacterium]